MDKRKLYHKCKKIITQSNDVILKVEYGCFLNFSNEHSTMVLHTDELGVTLLEHYSNCSNIVYMPKRFIDKRKIIGKIIRLSTVIDCLKYSKINNEELMIKIIDEWDCHSDNLQHQTDAVYKLIIKNKHKFK